jgi:hypothetical protein
MRVELGIRRKGPHPLRRDSAKIAAEKTHEAIGERLGLLPGTCRIEIRFKFADLISVATVRCRLRKLSGV